jgi:hypothetical protein
MGRSEHTVRSVESGLQRRDDVVSGGDLLYLVRLHRGRWSASAVAAALALPVSICGTARQWETMLDRLDVAISDVVMASASP